MCLFWKRQGQSLCCHRSRSWTFASVFCFKGSPLHSLETEYENDSSCLNWQRTKVLSQGQMINCSCCLHFSACFFFSFYLFTEFTSYFLGFKISQNHTFRQLEGFPFKSVSLIFTALIFKHTFLVLFCLVVFLFSSSANGFCYYKVIELLLVSSFLNQYCCWVYVHWENDYDYTMKMKILYYDYTK